jgi:hypothetical protein
MYDIISSWYNVYNFILCSELWCQVWYHMHMKSCKFTTSHMISYLTYDIIHTHTSSIDKLNRGRQPSSYDIIHTYRISYRISYHIWYHCVMVLAPYPNTPNPVESFNVKTDFDLQGNKHARPQLFFNCTLYRRGAEGSRGMSQGGQKFSQRGDPDLFQHAWAHQSYPLQCHAASWRSHAVLLGLQPAAALPLHLPSDKRPGVSTLVSMLHWR